MVEPIDPKTVSNLCNTFKVSKKTCEHFNEIYYNDIQPRLQKKYLAHLISSIEEMIDEKIKRERINETAEDTLGGKTRDFFIVLRQDPPPGKVADVLCFKNGAIINHIPSDNFKELRIFIAHELGHVLRFYKIITNDDNENHANLFAYFAINGKNKFYTEKVQDLLYPTEEQIISNIQELCPIKEERQHDD